MNRIASARIDLGLALMAARRKPGECFTQAEIAAWCDCTPRHIGQIEERALRKMRAALRRREVCNSAGDLARRAASEPLMEERARRWVPLKEWIAEQAELRAISIGAMWHRYYRRRHERPSLKHVNSRVVFAHREAA